MKKLFIAAVLCGTIITACKKDEKKYCYECSTTVKTVEGTQEIPMPEMSITMDQCGWTEDQAKSAGGTITTSTDGMTMKTTTTCNKK